MRLFCTVTVLLAATCLPTTLSQQQALFVKKDIIENGKRVARQTSADQMVQNILQWLQGVYTQNSRTIRQGTLREYLPPPNTQKPRPFQSVTQGNFPPSQIGDNNIISGGYPPAGSITPQPPFLSDGGFYTTVRPQTIPSIQIPAFNGYPTPSSPQPPFFPSISGYPGTVPTGPPGSTGFSSTGYPSSTGPTGFPSTGFPRPTSGYPGGSSTVYPAASTGFPGASTSSGPNLSGRFPSIGTDFPTTSTGFPTSEYSTSGPGFPTTTFGPSTTSPGSITGFPTSSPRPFPTASPTESTTLDTTESPTEESTTDNSETSPPFTSQTTSQPSTTPPPEENTIPSEEPTSTDSKSDGEEPTTVSTRFTADDDDDDSHPPHIHAINVECSKEMMTINVEFNRVFNGIIYSKGHYNSPECRYVRERSGQIRYTFTVNLNSCGTEFTNGFDTLGKSYLENVLVLQNEPGIQEVWDTIRAVRCLWEGNLKKALNVALSVGMLNQEIVTFSGDTAMARLDIQLGKGPFAPPASGLVKIGEVMTLVVSITGDPGFDIQVKDCRAKDSNGGNVVALTDERGCILKPKLFGAFQKTRNTGNTGASIIAYAFFNAFKFPDVMDLILECNVDLCKTDCEMCPEPNQKIEPGRRRRRDLYYQNATNDNSVTMGKMLKVILPEDLNEGHATISFTHSEGICMSTQGFVLSSAVLISLLTSSCLFSAYMWLKYQRLNLKK